MASCLRKTVLTNPNEKSKMIKKSFHLKVIVLMLTTSVAWAQNEKKANVPAELVNVKGANKYLKCLDVREFETTIRRLLLNTIICFISGTQSTLQTHQAGVVAHISDVQLLLTGWLHLALKRFGRRMDLNLSKSQTGLRVPSDFIAPKILEMGQTTWGYPGA
jgi:hypothetical protein